MKKKQSNSIPQVSKGTEKAGRTAGGKRLKKNLKPSSPNADGKSGNLKTVEAVQRFVDSGSKHRELLIEEFDRLHRSSIYRFLRSRFNFDPDEANQVFNDAMVAIWEHAERLDPTESPKAYVWRTAINAAYSYIRTNQFGYRQAAKKSGDVVLSENTKEHLPTTEVVLSLKISLSFLTEKQRTIIELYYGESMSAHEVGEILNLSTNTINYHRHRALVVLREHFGETHV